MKSLFEAVMGMTQEELTDCLDKHGINPDTVEVYPFQNPAYLVTEGGQKINLSDLKEVSNANL